MTSPFHDVQNAIKDYTPLEGLLYVVKALRDPDYGCPWDRLITAKDIFHLTIEETYEVIEALGNNNRQQATEELGDLLFHILLYAEILQLDFDAIVEGITNKMIARHPHVFDNTYKSAQDTVESWERRKPKKPMEIGDAYPSLMQAERIGKIAAKEGFDFPTPLSAYEKVQEEMEELKAALVSEQLDHIAEEYGDVLFAIAQLGRKLGVSPDFCLERAIRKFVMRYERMKASCGAGYTGLSLDVKEEFWRHASASQMHFRKMNGAGNDFVIVDERHKEFDLSTCEIRKICDRNFGIGADQFIFIATPTQEKADVKVLFYNQDGSKSGACGNGTRCVASFLMAAHLSQLVIETDDRLIDMTKTENNQIYANMGKATLRAPTLPAQKDIPDILQLIPEADKLIPVDIGNPHAVFLGIAQEDIEQISLAEIGPLIEKHPSFAEGCNVSLVSKIDAKSYRVRVWERGAGITMACGTAACAVMTAIHKAYTAQRPLPPHGISFHMNGGVLDVRLDADENLWLTGPCETNFQGFWMTTNKKHDEKQ